MLDLVGHVVSAATAQLCAAAQTQPPTQQTDMAVLPSHFIHRKHGPAFSAPVPQLRHANPGFGAELLRSGASETKKGVIWG